MFGAPQNNLCRRCAGPLATSNEKDEGICQSCNAPEPKEFWKTAVPSSPKLPVMTEVERKLDHVRWKAAHKPNDVCEYCHKPAVTQRLKGSYLYWCSDCISKADVEPTTGMCAKPIELQRNLIKMALWSVAAGVVSRARASQMMGISLSEFIANYNEQIDAMGPMSWAEQERVRLQTIVDTLWPLISNMKMAASKDTRPSRLCKSRNTECETAEIFLASIKSLKL